MTWTWQPWGILWWLPWPFCSLSAENFCNGIGSWSSAARRQFVIGLGKVWPQNMGLWCVTLYTDISFLLHLKELLPTLERFFCCEMLRVICLMRNLPAGCCFWNLRYCSDGPWVQKRWERWDMNKKLGLQDCKVMSVVLDWLCCPMPNVNSFRRFSCLATISFIFHRSNIWQCLNFFTSQNLFEIPTWTNWILCFFGAFSPYNLENEKTSTM